MSDYLNWPTRWRLLYYGQCSVVGFAVMHLIAGLGR